MTRSAAGGYRRRAPCTTLARMDFVQSAPVLANQYTDDRVLRSYLARALPASVRAAIESDLVALGAHAADAWQAARSREPVEPDADPMGRLGRAHRSHRNHAGLARRRGADRALRFRRRRA